MPESEMPRPSEEGGTVEAVLASELEQTQARLAALEKAFEEIVAYSEGAPPDDEHDPEGPTVAWERAQLSALRDQARDHLRDLQSAVRRLAEGDYGRCESCGGAIGDERLSARPAARRCVTCASSS